jgi:hypothetical protein
MEGARSGWVTRLRRGDQRGFGGTQRLQLPLAESAGTQAAGRSPHHKEVW